ncbi:MAG: hypothetical protein WAN10_12590, partial [Candidatus Acidiferrales bacterium]
NAPQPNTWAAGSEQLSFISVGCEERKIRAGGGFFLDFFLYRATRKLFPEPSYSSNAVAESREAAEDPPDAPPGSAFPATTLSGNFIPCSFPDRSLFRFVSKTQFS